MFSGNAFPKVSGKEISARIPPMSAEPPITRSGSGAQKTLKAATYMKVEEISIV